MNKTPRPTVGIVEQRRRAAAEAAAKAAQPRNPFDDFRARYANMPELFVREVFGVGPDVFVTIEDGEFAGQRKQVAGIWPNQLDVLAAYRRRDRFIAQKSGHRVGKTTVLAWVINHHMVFRLPQKTVCTAPTTKQLFEALYAETVTWFRRLPAPIQQLFEVKSEEIVLRASPTESFVSFRTSSAEKPEALAGLHANGPNAGVLIICDEASGIPDPIYEGAIGSMGNPNSIQILAGNPVRRAGLFYDVFHKSELRKKWTLFTASSKGHPNVSQSLVEEVEARYGEKSNAYRVRVLGEFPIIEDDTVIPWELIEAALGRDIDPRSQYNARSVWGLDVARKGKDACALAKRRGKILEEKVKSWRGKDTMQTVGLVKAEWDATPSTRRPEFIFVDAIGLGAGVADRLRELNLPAVSINVSESAAMNHKYVNLRSELWFKGREWLEQKNCSLAGDEETGHELSLPTFDYRSTGKVIVEEKKLTMKRTGEASPNNADAFLLTLCHDAATAQGLTGELGSWGQPLQWELKGLV